MARRQLPASVLAALQRRQTPQVQERPRKLRVLGIDASLRSTGIGIVEMDGSSFRFVDCRCIKNRQDAPISSCLMNVANVAEAYIAEFAPDQAAVEGIFMHKNMRTAMLLSHVRGVLVSVCAKAAVPVYEYAPRRIKQAVTGNGAATKEQIQRMMMRSLSLAEMPQEDAGDALAIAITHLHSVSGVIALAPEPM